MFVLLIFVARALAAGAYPTAAYAADHDLFDAGTFLPSIGYDACTPLTNQQYRALLGSLRVGCTGAWCVNGTFSCKQSDCYEVEHIIDRANSHNNCGRDIAGNMIMAYSRWNHQLGALSWQDVREEKSRVYGRIFLQAMDNILKCTPGCQFDDNTRIAYYLAHLYMNEVSILVLIGYAAGMSVVCCCIITAACCIKKQRQPTYELI